MDLRRYLSVLWRGLWLLVLGTVLAAGTSYMSSRSISPVYQASIKLLVTQGSNTLISDQYSSLLSAERVAKTYADLIKTRPVLEQVGRTLGINASYESLARRVDVKLVRDTQLMQIFVEDTDPALARDLANAIADVFIQQNEAAQQGRFQASRENLAREVDRLAHEIEQRTEALDALKARGSATSAPSDSGDVETNLLRRELSELQQTHANLLRSFEEVRLAEAKGLNTLNVVEPAVLPVVPVRPNVLLNTALAAAVGLALALGVVLLREHLNDTVSSPERLTALGLSPLAVVGEFPKDAKSRLVARPKEESEDGQTQAGYGYGYGCGYGYGGYGYASNAEAYRVLRTNLQFTGLDKPLRTVLITSAGPAEGKTITAANLALTLAQAGFGTLLVDADLRRPSVHNLFEISNQEGLTSLLLQDNPAADYAQATNVPNLWVLPSGPLPPNPSELLGSNRMAARVKELSQLADYVIFDSPPSLVVSDCLALAPQVDGVVLVVNARKTRVGAVRHARESLEKVGGRVEGAVLNRYHQKTGSYYYYSSDYGYGYGYGSRPNGSENGRAAAKEGAATKPQHR